MTFTEDLKLNFPSMIAENFRVVLTKYVRIAADVFINRVFKGNTVTDRDSAHIGHPQARSSQFVASLSVPGLPLSQNIASHFHGFRHAGSHAVSFVGGRGDAVEPPWAACKFFRIPQISFFDCVKALVKMLLQIATVLFTQIHVLGLLEILKECT